MADHDPAPTDTHRVRRVYALAPVFYPHDAPWNDYAAKQFDNWLAAHDAEVAHTIAARIRQNCTVPTDALNKAGDYIVYAVADWIENPPEWVNAPWVAPHG